MTKDIKDYLHLYLGCEFRYRYIDYQPNEWTVWMTLTHERLHRVLNDHSIAEIQLALRPLSDMTEEEVLELCKTASPVIFGDYRFAKWEVERSPHEICHWTVTNKNSIDYFNISSTDGDVDIYAKDGQPDPTNIDSNYRFWYLKKGFDLFGLIDAGLAIDKTKPMQ